MPGMHVITNRKYTGYVWTSYLTMHDGFITAFGIGLRIAMERDDDKGRHKTMTSEEARHSADDSQQSQQQSERKGNGTHRRKCIPSFNQRGCRS